MNKKVAIIFWSKTGNTKKVAIALKSGFEETGASVNIQTISNARDIDFFAYDLICIGSPVYQWSPPNKFEEYLQQKFNSYKNDGCVKLGAPKVKGRNVLIFCTYSGPHTGKNEAIPAVKNIGQFFEHLGFYIVDEWCILSEFQGSEEISTQGKMGDIRGLPSEEDLKEISTRAAVLISKL